MVYILCQKQNGLRAYHNRVVGSSDECNEEGQHHVDEEWDEGVKVDLAEDPHQCPTLFHLRKRHKHVVAVDQREEALRHHGQRAELRSKTLPLMPEREEGQNLERDPALRSLASETGALIWRSSSPPPAGDTAPHLESCHLVEETHFKRSRARSEGWNRDAPSSPQWSSTATTLFLSLSLITFWGRQPSCGRTAPKTNYWLFSMRIEQCNNLFILYL